LLAEANEAPNDLLNYFGSRAITPIVVRPRPGYSRHFDLVSRLAGVLIEVIPGKPVPN
jgi:hypothetical protein